MNDCNPNASLECVTYPCPSGIISLSSDNQTIAVYTNNFSYSGKTYQMVLNLTENSETISFSFNITFEGCIVTNLDIGYSNT